MKTSKTIDYIVSWIKNYKEVNAVNGFVVGVSGGIDSALTSTLCAMTGINTLCLNMPIRQKEEQYNSCLLYTSPSPRDGLLSRMPSSA